MRRFNVAVVKPMKASGSAGKLVGVVKEGSRHFNGYLHNDFQLLARASARVVYIHSASLKCLLLDYALTISASSVPIKVLEIGRIVWIANTIIWPFLCL